MKIIIVGNSTTDKYTIAKELQSINDDLSIAPVFSTDINLAGKITDNFIYYMSDEEAELSYKNDALMWIYSDEQGSIGITKPDMYACNIFVMTYAGFNNISNPTLKEFIKDDGVICFIDSKNNTRQDMMDSKFACERIFENPYLYFIDELDKDIVHTILKYMASNPGERKKIANELNN